MKEWKVKFFLKGCDTMYGYGLDSGENTEVDMPFIPRNGDVVWLPERCDDELKMHVVKCWEEKKCEDCPFMYCGGKSVDNIDTGDYIFVEDIIYNIDTKEVLIALSDGPQED